MEPERREVIDSKSLCVRSMYAMASGTLAEFSEVFAPDAVNREAIDEPPAGTRTWTRRVLSFGSMAALGL